MLTEINESDLDWTELGKELRYAKIKGDNIYQFLVDKENEAGNDVENSKMELSNSVQKLLMWKKLRKLVEKTGLKKKDEV